METSAGRRQVAILGAHSALAKALFESAGERELDADLRRYTSMEQIGEDLDPYSPAAIAEADLVILAFRGPLARELAEAARARNKPVVDAAGELASHPDARLIWPILDPGAGKRLVDGGYHVLSVGLASPIASLLRAMAGAEIRVRQATIATYECAASADQAGMDELSDQVRAVYTMKDVEPSIFPGRLAFSALPSLSPPGGGPGFDADDTLAREIASGAGPGATPELRVARVLIPAFSADAAVVELEVGGLPDRARVVAALKAARGLHFVEGAPPASADAVGRDDALVGRLRIGEGRIGLWVASDRLRHGSATAVSVLLEQWLT